VVLKRILLILVVLGVSAGTGYTAGGKKADLKAVPRMTKAELKANLDNKDFVIIDVRTPKDYGKSDYKIKGAVRENPMDVTFWYNYPKNKVLVLYCA
jgi:hypothetical protein